MPTPALRIVGLCKRFASTRAVDGLDLEIGHGELHALLGPNGAGKTTTLRIVAGLIRPDGGRVEVLGHDVVRSPLHAKRVLAFVPDDPPLYGKLWPLEYLEFVAGLWGTPTACAEKEAEELLRWMDLVGHAGKPIEAFSRGMRQKLALAGALIHDPEVMILDEPLTGMDAAGARRVKDVLVARVNRGKTVVLTTHVLEIAERLAGRISIIQHGRMLAQGTLAELRARVAALGGAAVGTQTLEDVFLDLTASG